MEAKIEPHEQFNSEDEELSYYGKVYESVLNKLDAVNTSLKDWLSHLLMIAATLLGVLAALNPVKQTDTFLKKHFRYFTVSALLMFI